MTDPDKLADELARSAAVRGVDFISASGRHGPVGQENLTLAGFFRERGLKAWAATVNAFLERYPAWRVEYYERGLELNPNASAHAKMAWAAFVMDVQRAEGLAP